MADFKYPINIGRHLKRCLDSHRVAVGVIIEPLAQLLMDNPDKAVDFIRESFELALDKAYTDQRGNHRAFVEAFGGGPKEDIPRAVGNAIGAAYPFLEREQKDRALKSLLNIYDSYNFMYVNGAASRGFTPGIREPLLLADISITRGIYWPGLDEGRDVLRRFGNFYDLQKELIDTEGMFKKESVESDFVVAYSLLRGDFCDYGNDYLASVDEDFLDRTLKAIVSMRFARVENSGVLEGEARLMELFPKAVHSRIPLLRVAGDWVDYKKFP